MNDAPLAELIAQIEALGIGYRPPSGENDAEQERLAADEFLYEARPFETWSRR